MSNATTELSVAMVSQELASLVSPPPQSINDFSLLLFCPSGMLLPATPVNASVIFQPLLDNGIVLMVTAENGTVPVLAVGLFNGKVNSCNCSEDLL